MDLTNARTVEDFQKIIDICQNSIQNIKHPKPFRVGDWIGVGTTPTKEYMVIQNYDCTYSVVSQNGYVQHQGANSKTLIELTKEYGHNWKVVKCS